MENVEMIFALMDSVFVMLVALPEEIRCIPG